MSRSIIGDKVTIRTATAGKITARSEAKRAVGPFLQSKKEKTKTHPQELRVGHQRGFAVSKARGVQVWAILIN